MRPLVSGSLAYDYLMRVDGRFVDHFASVQDGAFYASFIAPSLQKLFGGCAANIAYALHQLGDTPLLMATAGADFAPYREYLREQGISTEHILELDDFYTAQAYISTDDDGNQFIAFHPGATAEAHRQSIADAADAAPTLAIVAPNGKEGMLRHCHDLAVQGTPFIFDPGQAIGMFSGEDLLTCLRQCAYAVFNAGEFAVLQNATDRSAAALAATVDALIVTHGEDGSEAFLADRVLRTACVRAGETRGPTGCGDAYRAGIMHGLMRNWAWERIIAFAATVAGVKATHHGGQGYALSAAQTQELSQSHEVETIMRADART